MGDDDENNSAESDSNDNKKGSKKESKKKKSAPGEYTLSKLKKILRAVGAANPRVYKSLKDKSNKQQIAMIKEILTEKEVDFSNLSEKAIKKLKSEWNLKREMEELGIDTSKKNEDGQEAEDEYENGVTLSSRRSRRKRNKVVSYKPPKMKFEESEEDGNDDDADDNDKAEKDEQKDEEVEEEEEDESEGDVYEPPSESDEDEDYEM